MGTALADGLYRVTRGGVCAGFIVERGAIVDCAPVLSRRIDWWVRSGFARRVDSLRVLVTGSRQWPRERAVVVRDVIAAAAGGDRDPGCVTVVHGACQDREGRLLGADRWADLTAERLGYRVERLPADWARFGRGAGMIRNRAMVALGADVCLAFPLGASPGTRGCLREAERAGIPVRVTEG